jgi:hypothetical protein
MPIPADFLAISEGQKHFGCLPTWKQRVYCVCWLAASGNPPEVGGAGTRICFRRSSRHLETKSS